MNQPEDRDERVAAAAGMRRSPGRAVLPTSSVSAWPSAPTQGVVGTVTSAALFVALVAAILVLIGLVLLYKGIHALYPAELRQA